MMRRLFRFKRRGDEAWVGDCTRTILVRAVWKKRKLRFLSEVIAESAWRTLGWVCDKRSHAVLESMQRIFDWRSICWWKCESPTITQDGSTHRNGTIVNVSGTS